jgi:hypothetical protein
VIGCSLPGRSQALAHIVQKDVAVLDDVQHYQRFVHGLVFGAAVTSNRPAMHVRLARLALDDANAVYEGAVRLRDWIEGCAVDTGAGGDVYLGSFKNRVSRTTAHQAPALPSAVHS